MILQPKYLQRSRGNLEAELQAAYAAQTELFKHDQVRFSRLKKLMSFRLFLEILEPFCLNFEIISFIAAVPGRAVRGVRGGRRDVAPREGESVCDTWKSWDYCNLLF